MQIIHALPSTLGLVALLAVGTAIAAAEDDLRLVPQVAYGTAGVEPGLALEWRQGALVVRPEVLLSEDSRLGAGGAVLYDISAPLGLPGRQAVAVGPRVIYHNADDTSWEADGMVTWGFDLSEGLRPWRHTIGVLAAAGVRHDREEDDNRLGVTGGAFYAYRF